MNEREWLKERGLLSDEINRLRVALAEIRDGYGAQHGSQFCRYVATAALTAPQRGDQS